MARDWARLSYHDLKQIIIDHDEADRRWTDTMRGTTQERDNLRETLASRDAEIRELQAKLDAAEGLATSVAMRNGLIAELQAKLELEREITTKLTAHVRELNELVCSSEPHQPIGRNNPDGTTTWSGVPVTIPTGMIPSCVRPPKKNERFLCRSFEVPASHDFPPTDPRVILAPPVPPVTWQAPSWLPDGTYCTDTYHGTPGFRQDIPVGKCYWPDMFRDWTYPPKHGRYKVVNGVGTWIGDA